MGQGCQFLRTVSPCFQAHKKTFYVKLKLGTEEYAADGASIKKAQHAAAAIALTQSQYKHPPPKVPKYGEVESECS